jgi:hypothetical protein
MRSDHCTHCVGSHTGARPCLASATEKTRAWLLVEHPGPWAERLEETELFPAVSRVLARARKHSVRVQLIRRPGRRRATPPVQVYAGWSGADPWLEGRELADPAELDELDLGAVGGGSRPDFGTPARKLFLVCTNGKHNVCCARLGAPLARALHDSFRDAVWETTHLGGDHYSANMVCLPDGLYYGDLAIVDGLVAAERYLHGEVWLKRYRGRAGLPQAVQAAEHFLRERFAIDPVAAVTIESVRDASDASVASGLSGGSAAGPRATDVIACFGAERYLISVERVRLDPCGPECTADVSTYSLKSLGVHVSHMSCSVREEPGFLVGTGGRGFGPV